MTSHRSSLSPPSVTVPPPDPSPLALTVALSQSLLSPLLLDVEISWGPVVSSVISVPLFLCSNRNRLQVIKLSSL